MTIRPSALPSPRRHFRTGRAHDGSRVRIAYTDCGYRWNSESHDSPWEREAPTTSFGREYARACLDLLDPFIERTGRTFMHGGCAMLADATAMWSGGRLVPYAVRYYGDVDHVVSSDGRSFLDCDGRFDRRGFACKSYMLDNDMNVEIDRSPWDATASTIARDAGISRWLADGLAARLRSPVTEPWRLRA